MELLSRVGQSKYSPGGGTPPNAIDGAGGTETPPPATGKGIDGKKRMIGKEKVGLSAIKGGIMVEKGDWC